MTPIDQPPAADDRLLESCGLQIEYAVVDADSLSIRAIADEVLAEVAGDFAPEVARGPVHWSHKLAKHGIRIAIPFRAADPLDAGARLQESIAELAALLHSRGARLLPGGMHPWMAPATETQLWDHSGSNIYQLLHRAFDCRRHGWANLQGAHVSLPFSGDDEFARLHAATRLALPLLPALAASSPFVDGGRADALDYRLVAYRDSASLLPAAAGSFIPETASCRAEYEAAILEPLARDIAALDPAGLLNRNWLNRRAAVARFDGGAIDIRALDAQECPAADAAVATATLGVVRALYEEKRLDTARQAEWPTGRLAAVFDHAIGDADGAVFDDRDYIDVFGFPERGRCRARDLWQHLFEIDVARAPAATAPVRDFFELYVRRGSLARRLVDAFERRAPGAGRRAALVDVYRALADCLRDGALFEDDPAADLLLPY